MRASALLLIFGLLSPTALTLAGDAERSAATKAALGEVEIARDEKPLPGCKFKLDSGKWRYQREETGGLKRTTLTRDQAHEKALKFLGENFEFDRKAVRVHHQDALLVGSGDDQYKAGWFFSFVQTHKGAGISDLFDVNFDGDDIQSASFEWWKVVAEFAPARALTEVESAEKAFKAFIARYPEHKGSELDCNMELHYVEKKEAAPRRVPVWTITLEAPSLKRGNDAETKPIIHAFVLNAWSGEVLTAQRVLVPVDNHP